MIIEELDVYKRAHSLTLQLYKITHSFPRDELYGITSQIRRAAASINANLMEGAARQTNNEFCRFIYIARGSIEELKYHITLARDLKFISKDSSDKIIDELKQIARMINGLLKVINNNQ
jgi:four helix bundle protein